MVLWILISVLIFSLHFFQGIEVAEETSVTNDHFEISWTKEVWESVKPRKKIFESNQRVGFVLGPEYGNWLFDVLWDKFRIQCCFAIKRSQVHDDCQDTLRPWVEITAECAECGASLRATVEDKDELEDGSVLMNVAILDRKDIAHTDARRLTGERRAEIQGLLDCRKPTSVRRLLIGRTMGEGEKILPPTLPSKSVLRKAKEEGRNKKLGIPKGQTLWESLQELKSRPQTASYIRDEGTMKNFVSYFSKAQIGLYNQIQKKFGHSISIDATSGLARRIERNGVLGPAQFLFCVVSYIGQCNFFK